MLLTQLQRRSVHAVGKEAASAISALVKAGRWRHAVQLGDKLPPSARNTYTYSAMLAAYAAGRQVRQVHLAVRRVCRAAAHLPSTKRG